MTEKLTDSPDPVNLPPTVSTDDEKQQALALLRAAGWLDVPNDLRLVMANLVNDGTRIRDERDMALVAVASAESDVRTLRSAIVASGPIPMILFCPACYNQHIDRPDPETGWTNPVHRTHQCQVIIVKGSDTDNERAEKCGHKWRPANVPTTGVERLEGEAAPPVVAPHAPLTLPEREAAIQTLRPFARLADLCDDYKHLDDLTCWYQIKAGHLRQARNTLALLKEVTKAAAPCPHRYVADNDTQTMTCKICREVAAIPQLIFNSPSPALTRAIATAEAAVMPGAPGFVGALPGESAYPTMTCPTCHATAPDMDGFGCLFCPRSPETCYCSHPVKDGAGKCEICGRVEADKPEELPAPCPKCRRSPCLMFCDKTEERKTAR